MKDFFRRCSKNLPKANIACVDVQKNIFISDFSFHDSGQSSVSSKMQNPHFQTPVTFMAS